MNEKKKNKSALKFAKKNEVGKSKGFVKITFTAMLSAVICTLLLSFIACIVLPSTKDPLTLLVPVAYTVVGISLLCAGALACRLSGGDILSSVAAGAFYTLLAFCIHLIVCARASSAASSLLFLTYPAVALIGGVIGRPRAQKRKRFKAK